MNAKAICIMVLTIILCYCCVSCASTSGTMVSGIGNGTDQTRTDIADLGAGQTDLAITGQQLANNLDNLESAIGSGTEKDAELATILRAIRNRPSGQGGCGSENDIANKK